MAVFAMVFGYAVCVLPFVLNNAWVAADNPYWHFLGLSFSPCSVAVHALCEHGNVVFAQLGRLLWTLCVSYRITFCYRNPRATSLRPAERHNARGSLHPLRVRGYVTSSPHSSPVGKASPLLEEGSRIPSRFYVLLLAGRFFRTFSLFFAFFSHSYVSIAFLNDFF